MGLVNIHEFSLKFNRMTILKIFFVQGLIIIILASLIHLTYKPNSAKKIMQPLEFNLKLNSILGGSYRSNMGLNRQKVAIIVPFRERNSHLRIFLPYIHYFLQKQHISYTVFVIEQSSKYEYVFL